MQKIIWLDDETVSISYERDVLIPERIDYVSFKIESFETINEFMEYISFSKIFEDDIFVIDIMLIDEDEIILPNGELIKIPDDLMAGVTLYREYIKKIFPRNPVILYTSREHEGEVFNRVTEDILYDNTLFLIDKWQKDTKFINVLKKFIRSDHE